MTTKQRWGLPTPDPEHSGDHTSPSGWSAGFTLVELIVVIVISGILASVVAVVITRPIEGYVALSRRAGLVDVAETALRRIQRDVRRALPNSLRVKNGGTRFAVEMVNTVDGVSYRAAPPPGNPDQRLEFNRADNNFAVLGHFRTLSGVANSTAYRLVVYNLDSVDGGGNPLAGVNVYSPSQSPGPYPPSGSHVITPAGTAITITTGANEDQVSLGSAHQFALASPEQRLLVVDGPVSYVCDTGAQTLMRYWSYPLQASQPITAGDFGGASSALVADRVAGCSFSYFPGSLSRRAQLTAELTVASDGEQVRLLHQVHVDNSP